MREKAENGLTRVIPRGNDLGQLLFNFGVLVDEDSIIRKK